MKRLFDQNLSPSLVDALRDLYPGSLHVRDVGLRDADDDAVGCGVDDDFRVQAGRPVNLKRWPTVVTPLYRSTEQYHRLLKKHIEELSSLQHLLYASPKSIVSNT